jgi:dihydroflavonol-4-reductase
MIALVTGSTGFIGSHLCRGLLTAGYQVRAFHRSTSPLTLLQGLPVEHAIGDITQPASLQSALHGIDIVFHTAAKLGKSTPHLTYQVTVMGTRNVLKACLHSGVSRVVHTSSVAALGIPGIHGTSLEDSTQLQMNETHSWNYRPNWWFYGYAKHLAEMEVQYAVSQGLDVVIVNPTLVIGAGDINRVSGEVILRVAKGQLRITSSGGLNAIHIDDIVAGHLAALSMGNTGERYILGNENVSHNEFLKLIADVVGTKPPTLKIPAPVLRVLVKPISAIEQLLPFPFSGEALRKIGYYFYYDKTKAMKDLGFTAVHSIRESIEQSYQWYIEQKII